MRRNVVIYNRDLSNNIVGWYNYHISKSGRLYRYYPNRGIWMLLKGVYSRGRVYHILRSSNRKRSRIQVSRLVAIAWIPNPENKPFVCHKDNNPKNNRYTNLYWGTQKENMQQCVRDKRLRPQGKIPLTIKDILNIRRDYLDSQLTLREISEKYNITHIHRYLSEIKHGHRLSYYKVQELIKDKSKGFTNRELSIKYGVSRASVSHYLNRYKERKIYENQANRSNKG